MAPTCVTLHIVPRTYPPKRTLIAVRLSPDGIAAIDRLAKRNGITRSHVVRAALAEYIAAHGAPDSR